MLWKRGVFNEQNDICPFYLMVFTKHASAPNSMPVVFHIHFFFFLSSVCLFCIAIQAYNDVSRSWSAKKKNTTKSDAQVICGRFNNAVHLGAVSFFFAFIIIHWMTTKMRDILPTLRRETTENTRQRSRHDISPYSHADMLRLRKLIRW